MVWHGRWTLMAAQRKPARAREPTWGSLRKGATVLVDTAPFIYILEGNNAFAERFVGLFEAADMGDINIAISSITLAEVLTGPWKARKPALAKRYERALNQYKVIPVTAAIAALAAQLRSRYVLNLPDAIQLASALDIGADAMVTHDRDFSRVKDLPVLMGM
jgi:predicted nucleic acid-binding protein